MTEKRKSKLSKERMPMAAFSSFHMEADRTGNGMSLILCGIIGISDFSDSFIHLLSHGGRITVTGRGLFIRVFENGAVEIVGRVEGISFKYGKN